MTSIKYIKLYLDIKDTNHVVLLFENNAPQSLIDKFEPYHIETERYRMTVDEVRYIVDDYVYNHVEEHNLMYIYVNFIDGGIWFSTYMPGTEIRNKFSSIKTFKTLISEVDGDIYHKIPISTQSNDAIKSVSKDKLQVIINREIRPGLPYYCYPYESVTYITKYLESNLPDSLDDKEQLIQYADYFKIDDLEHALISLGTIKDLRDVDIDTIDKLRDDIAEIDEYYEDQLTVNNRNMDKVSKEIQFKVNIVFIKLVNMIRNNIA